MAGPPTYRAGAGRQIARRFGNRSYLLDRQIRDTIKQFAQVGSVVGLAEDSAHLRRLLHEGKRIVITTVQKFPFILDTIGYEHRGRKFAIIIDEVHSSQGGQTSASVSMALGEAGSEDEDKTTENRINQLMESKKLLANASYFAFTATPKNKTWKSLATRRQRAGTPGISHSTSTPRGRPSRRGS